MAPFMQFDFEISHDDGLSVGNRRGDIWTTEPVDGVIVGPSGSHASKRHAGNNTSKFVSTFPLAIDVQAASAHSAGIAIDSDANTPALTDSSGDTAVHEPDDHLDLSTFAREIATANRGSVVDIHYVDTLARGWFFCPAGIVLMLRCASRTISLHSFPHPVDENRPGAASGCLLRASLRDSFGSHVCIAWAFLQGPDDPKRWLWFLNNLRNAIKLEQGDSDLLKLQFALVNTSPARSALATLFPTVKLVCRKDTLPDLTETTALGCLQRLWITAAQDRHTQMDNAIDYLKINHYRALEACRELTTFARSRFEHFRSTGRFTFTAPCWDQSRCDGAVRVEDATLRTAFEVTVRIRDGEGRTSCKCDEPAELEGICCHALSAVAVLGEFGLNTSTFTPFNVGRWAFCYIALPELAVCHTYI